MDTLTYCETDRQSGAQTDKNTVSPLPFTASCWILLATWCHSEASCLSKHTANTSRPSQTKKHTSPFVSLFACLSICYPVFVWLSQGPVLCQRRPTAPPDLHISKRHISPSLPPSPPPPPFPSLSVSLFVIVSVCPCMPVSKANCLSKHTASTSRPSHKRHISPSISLPPPLSLSPSLFVSVSICPCKPVSKASCLSHSQHLQTFTHQTCISSSISLFAHFTFGANLFLPVAVFMNTSEEPAPCQSTASTPKLSHIKHAFLLLFLCLSPPPPLSLSLNLFVSVSVCPCEPFHI